MAAGSFFELNGDTEINGIFNIGDRTKAKRCKTCFETHVRKARFQLRGFRGGGKVIFRDIPNNVSAGGKLVPNLEVKVILLQLPFQFCAQDCEMSFVCQDDVLQLFEGMIRAIFKSGLVGEFFLGFLCYISSESLIQKVNDNIGNDNKGAPVSLISVATKGNLASIIFEG